jgi:hypothetical protein
LKLFLRVTAQQLASRRTHTLSVARHAHVCRQILNGSAPPAYVVASASTGLADAMVGMVTVFYYALVTRRALLWHHTMSQLDAAFIEHHIQWHTPHEVRARVQQLQQQPDGTVVGDQRGSMVKYKLRAIDMVRQFETGNLSNLGRGFEWVLFKAHRGLTYQLFNNPYHKEQLHNWGLRPETAFGCVLNYIVKLQPDIMQHYSAAFRQLSDPSVLKIGMQIRTGDDTLATQGIQHIGQYHAFFSCAEEVEASRIAAYPGGVLWFLITDSQTLREHAQELYGAKLLFLNDSKLGHIGHRDRKSRCGVSRIDALRSAAAENWLFALADVHIISKQSGFGRTAAFRSLKSGSIYTIPHPHFNARQQYTGMYSRKCGVLDYDSHDIAASVWSRI